MQFLTGLFGGSGTTILMAVLSLGIVLLLIVLVLWGLKALSGASARVSRTGQRRLTIVESVLVDPKRRLLIVRRDNVEHLILTGGPQDVVVETGFAPEAEVRRPPRRTAVPRTEPTAAELPSPPPVRVEQRPARLEPQPAATAQRPVALEMLRRVGNPTTNVSAAPVRRPAHHPGLLRPAGRGEPVAPLNPEIAGPGRPDSARTGLSDAAASRPPSGQPDFADEDDTYPFAARTADGN